MQCIALALKVKTGSTNPADSGGGWPARRIRKRELGVMKVRSHGKWNGGGNLN